MQPELNLRQDEARAMNRTRRRIGYASTATGLAALAAVVAAAGGLGTWGCIAALAVGLPLVDLPFAVAGYRLSRRYGLSRQTPRGWLADRAKGLGVGAVLGVAVAGGLILIQRGAGDWWPLPAWAAAVAFGALLAALFPVLLLPLFLKSEHLEGGELADAMWATARAAGVRVRELRLLKMGEKTAAANAMVAGLGPTVRIYVSDTLAEPEEDETPPEALGRSRVVLAHELGHHRHRDVWRLLGVSAASTAAGIAGAWAGVAWLAPDGAGRVTALPAAALGFSLASALVSPLVAAYARRRERAADAYAVALTGEGETFARAMERLVARNLAELDPPRWHHLLTASHPAPCERIAAARSSTSGRLQDYTSSRAN
jgi:Zn-dependent protease with chaperone function